MILVPPIIDFQEEGHIYRVNDKVKVSPTKIIEKQNLGGLQYVPELGGYIATKLKEMPDGSIRETRHFIQKHVIENKGAIGKGYHYAAYLLVRGEIGDYVVHESVKPYFEAFQLFLAREPFVPEPQYAEYMVYSQHHDYCTTIDIIGRYKGIRAIGDYKCSQVVDRAVEIQTGFGEIAFNEYHVEDPVKIRFSLHLKKNGTYKFDDHTHMPASLALDALRLYRWKYKKGVL